MTALEKYNNLAHTRRRLEVLEDYLEGFREEVKSEKTTQFNNSIAAIKVYLGTLKEIDEIKVEIEKVPEYAKVLGAIESYQRSMRFANRPEVARTICANMYPIRNGIYKIGLKYKPEMTPEIKITAKMMIRKYREVGKSFLEKMKDGGPYYNSETAKRLWFEHYAELYSKFLSTHKDVKAIPGIVGISEYDDICDILSMDNYDYSVRIYRLSKILDMIEPLVSWIKSETGILLEVDLPEDLEFFEGELEKLRRGNLEKEKELKKLREELEGRGKNQTPEAGVEAKNTDAIDELEKLSKELSTDGFLKMHTAGIRDIVDSIAGEIGTVLQTEITKAHLTEDNRKFLNNAYEIKKKLEDMPGRVQLDPVTEEEVRELSYSLNSFIRRQRENRIEVA